MKRTTYNKLIRDRIPEIIEENGATHKTRVLKDNEYKQALLKKIIEEADELVEASSVAKAMEDEEGKRELHKEVGDVLEIINYIIKVFGLDKEEIEKIRKERKESRGGFDKKLFLEYAEE